MNKLFLAFGRFVSWVNSFNSFFLRVYFKIYDDFVGLSFCFSISNEFIESSFSNSVFIDISV